MTEYISFSELKVVVAEKLEEALGITEFDIIFADLNEESAIWKANVEFFSEEEQFHTRVALKVDAKTGELLGIWKDRAWD